MDLNEFLRSCASASLVVALEKSVSLAEAGGTRIYLAHLIDSLLDDDTVRSRLSEDLFLKVKSAVAKQIASLKPVLQNERGRFAFDLASLCEPAVALAKDSGATLVSPLILLATCLSSGWRSDEESVRTQEIVRAAGLTLDRLVPGTDREKIKRADFTYKSLGFGIDLTAMARAGFWPSCPLIGAERELKRLTVIISSGADSVVLVGEAGVGKTALVQGLAFHLARGTRPLIPPMMDNWTIVMISPANLLADTGGRGELEARLDKMLTFFRKHPEVIPFFDEIHTLLDTDDPSARAIATAIKPPMVSGQFRCIGATTDKEYARFIASDEALSSRFTKLLIPEPTPQETKQILCGILEHIMPPRAKEQGIQVSLQALDEVVRITENYRREDRQPRKSIMLLRQVLTEKAFECITSPSDGSIREVTPADVARVFSENSGIPVDELDQNRPAFYRRLYDNICARVRGQEEAVAAVVSWLELQSKGWVDPRRPRGRFLFLGPPGVGKTELALRLAEEVMRDRGSLIVKNMAEYRGEGARTKFMGADPGYIGFGQVPTVYSKVMMRKYSVVVLDEFEKADPSLADPLISILDGQAEDAQARRVDFSQCIIILTSNALSNIVGPDIVEDEIRRRLITLGGIWQPSLVDRIDRIVIFRPLSKRTLLEILRLQIEDRRKQSTQPLPRELELPEVQESILECATAGGYLGSARRIERALLDWLTKFAARQHEDFDQGSIIDVPKKPS